MKHKILFVDDERNILQGLKRMFHDIRGLWDMRFANSGQEALQMLAEAPADVIVSDIRMPEINGVDLLTRVKTEHPEMVRIILSADMDQQTILQTVRLAHQFIAKPSDTEALKLTNERACCISQLLCNEALKGQLARMESLPGLPELYRRVVNALEDPECAIQQVGAIIAEDLAMTTKILQLVNSAFFGIARHFSSPAEAAVYLGLDIVRALVLTIGLFADFQAMGISDTIVKAIYDHSFSTGRLAREIALSASLPKEQTDDTFMAGLLHDLGKLVLAYNFPETYGAFLETDPYKEIAIQVEEKKRFGATHTQVGGYLVGLWGLPCSIVEAVAFHHTPHQYPSNGFDALGAVHVSNALVHHLHGHGGTGKPIAGIDNDYLRSIGMTDHLNEWMTLAEKVV